MSTRTPWQKFYHSDWRSDPALRACSPAARGIWLDMIGLMHDADPYGHLLINGVQPSIKTLSGLFNVHHKSLIAAMKELSEHGVYSVDTSGVIFSRRMVRDFANALRDKENGRRGGNPQIANGLTPPLTRAPPAEVKAQKPEARVQKNTLSNESVAHARKRVATDRTLPSAMTPEMVQHAAKHGFLNGNAERLFGAWRDHHLAKGTVIADTTASFRTWVANELKFNPRSAGHDRQPSQPAKLYGISAANAEFRARSDRGSVEALRELGALGDDGLFADPEPDWAKGSG